MSTDSNENVPTQPSSSGKKLELAEKSIAIISVTSGLVSAITPLLMNIEDIAEAVNGNGGQLNPSTFLSFTNPPFVVMILGICATIFGSVFALIMRRKRMSRVALPGKGSTVFFKMNAGRQTPTIFTFGLVISALPWLILLLQTMFKGLVAPWWYYVIMVAFSVGFSFCIVRLSYGTWNAIAVFKKFKGTEIKKTKF